MQVRAKESFSCFSSNCSPWDLFDVKGLLFYFFRIGNTNILHVETTSRWFWYSISCFSSSLSKYDIKMIWYALHTTLLSKGCWLLRPYCAFALPRKNKRAKVWKIKHRREYLRYSHLLWKKPSNIPFWKFQIFLKNLYTVIKTIIMNCNQNIIDFKNGLV